MALTKINSNNIAVGAIEASALEVSGVTAGDYGSASQVPVITVNQHGLVTSVTETAVAGVSNVSYNSSTGVLTIDTSAGTTYTVDLSVGANDSLVLSGLTVNGNTSIGGHIIPDTDITYDLGSATNRFRDLYLSAATIHLGDVKISKNSTTGTVDILDTNDDPVDLSNSYNSDAVDGMVDDIITQIEALVNA